MQTTPDTWTGPGSGTNQVAPNVFQVVDLSAGSNWQMQVTARNAGGGLVTVASWQLMLWDVTAGSASLTVTGTNANTINLSGNMLTVGHVYTYTVNFITGTCDHTLVSTTSIDATAGHWKNYPICSVWRAAAWHEIGGPGVRVWRGGAWQIVNNGVSVWRAGVWNPL